MPVTSGVFARLWKFVDHRAAGDQVARADLDTALDDFVPALNSALSVLTSATAAASAAADSAAAAASAGSTAGATAGSNAAGAAMAPGLASIAATLALMEDLLADAQGYVSQITPSNFLALAQTTAYAGSCDAITTTGLVRLGTGATNGPAGTVQGDFVLTLVDDASNAIQFAMGDNGIGRAALRRKVAGVWDTWSDLVLGSGAQTVSGNKTLSGVTALSGGATASSVTTASVSDGTPTAASTYRPDPNAATKGNMRHITNGAAFTLAAPNAAGDYTMTVLITNNATAGAITMSGFTKVFGDAFTTTNGHVFLVSIVKQGAVVTAVVQACQ